MQSPSDERRAKLAKLLQGRAAEAQAKRAPASFAQERLWFLEQMSPGGATWNIPVEVRLEGRLDEGALRAGLRALSARHAPLRTTFVEREGRPEQRVAPSLEAPLATLDARGLAGGEVRARLEAEARRPFDLERGPLWRALLARLGEGEHALLLTLHHLIADGWSMGVLVRDLGELYAAFCEGRAARLPALALQYGEYARWQRERLSGGDFDAQVAYWRSQLDPDAVLDLPTDRPRPAVLGAGGARVTAVLPAPVARAASALGRGEGGTLFTALLAAFQALLGRYAGQSEVVVGTPVAGRERAEVEGLLGLFVNTVALRADLSGRPSFRSLVGRVREATLGAFAHQDVPFEKLVEALGPRRDPSRSPLVQAMFVMRNAPLPPLEAPGLRLEARPVETGTAKAEVTLIAFEAPEGLQLTLEYSTDLFVERTAAGLLAHYRALLEGALARPDDPIDEASLLTEAERHLSLVTWNATRADFERDACVHELFERQARETPDAVALVDGALALPYAELDRRAERLAGALRRQGVGPEALVGVCLERDWRLVVALLGVLKAGGAYVPLDPTYPRERLAQMLGDARPAAVVTLPHLGAAFASPSAPLVHVDEALERDAEGAADGVALGPRPTADNVAYVLYTSGSTGRPKGVAVQHRNAVALLRWAVATFGPALAGVLASTSVAFDLSVFELFAPLSMGGSVLLAPNVLEAARLPAAEHITLVNTVPSAMAELLRAGGLPRGVRVVNLAGEPLAATLVELLYEQPGVERVYDLYGPSETTTYSTYALRRAGGPATIGGPIANERCYVLDAAMRPAPVGVPGELYIGGEGIARGYLGRPDATAERFVPDPFGHQPGARLYKTGDRVRWRADGQLEYLGRLDSQVKLRGFRIELGEVEAALLRQPGVRQAAALVREDRPGDRRLVAYVAGEAGASLKAAEVRAGLQQTLPAYLVPSAIVTLGALPRTPNGKLDRKALPAPEWHSSASRRPARDALEGRLLGLFQEALGASELPGVDDDFFALGGHSLLATRLVSRVRSELGVELPLRSVFEAPTAAALAERLRSLEARSALPPPVPLRRTGPLPVSFAQQRLWFLDRLEPRQSTYNMPIGLRVDGPLDVRALGRALGEVVGRHEVLRTTFDEAEGVPSQRVREAEPVALPLDDLAALPPAARAAEARRRASTEAALPFDLLRGPLLRARLLRLDEREHWLLLTVHHIVSDGWSTGVFSRELGELYAAFCEGRPAALAPLPVQYADYALWQRSWLRGEALERRLGYWRTQLEGAPPLELPTDRPRPLAPSRRGARVPVHLPREVAEGVRLLARHEGVTPFMLLLAALQALLARYSGQNDVSVGTPVAGRTHAELEPLVGLFVNTLVLRARMAPGMTFRELLAQVRVCALEAFEHQDVPFEKLVEALEPSRDPSRSPLFQAFFALQNAPPALRLPGLSIEALPVESATAKFDLSLTLTETPQGFEGSLEYSADLFERATAERMAWHLRRLLEGALARPDAPLDELPPMTDDERRRVLLDWNATRAEYPLDTCVHELFERQARETPDAVALEFGDERWSYARLEAHADRLARRLRASGVGPEVRVGVLLERSCLLPCALLAVLKAGGAYVPLDPDYPRERLAQTLEDAGALVLLTDAHAELSLPPPVGRHEGAGAAEPFVRLHADDPSPAPAEAGPLVNTPARADNVAYVLYTSGSTGRPKGVLVTHGALANHMRWIIDAYRLGPNDRLLQKTSPAFDASVWEFWAPLVSGGCLVLAPPGAHRDPHALAAELVRAGITVVQMVPAALQPLLQEPALAGATRLRWLFSGGEPLPNELGVKLARLLPSARLVNLYGPTEATIDATAAEWPGAGAAGDTAPLGRPIANVRCYVLDAAMRPAPVGVPGELYIGGEGIARGYLGRPDATAERFVPDPFGHQPGARLYKTGDRVRWRADGQLEYLGRLDSQVKLRGFRIELGEVEAALLRQPGVRQAAALVREDAPGDKRLVAYVAGAEGSALEGEGLVRSLRQKLPGYLVPSAVVVLERLPLTPNGKLDRKALPAPELAPGSSADAPPRGELEAILILLFEEILRVRPLGRRAHFFALGGHSLLATQLVARIKGLTGRHLPLLLLFQNPTVEELAAALHTQPASSRAARALVPMQAGRAPHVPLFFVHGGGGSALGYADLASRLGPARPFYGLQSPALEGGELPPPSVEAIARRYLAEVREERPHGPYLLGGWSFGGLVAFEMARQLRDAGEEVPLVVLVDSPAPGPHPPPEPAELGALAAFADATGVSWRNLPLDPAHLERLGRRERLAYLLECAQRVEPDSPSLRGLTPERLERLFDLFCAHVEAQRLYRPGPYDGATLVVRAAGRTPGRNEAADLGWGAWAREGVRTREAPGDHNAVVRAPHVAELARVLASEFDPLDPPDEP